MPDTHARFSPSAANRRIHCPPSLLLEEQFEEGESVYAAEGTAGHALAEHLIRKYLKQRTTRPTSEYYKDELLEAVDEYVSFVIGEIEDARRECQSPVLLVEQRIDASEYVDSCFGTADMVIITDQVAHVIDLKLGKGVDKVVMGLAIVLAVCLSVGLFVLIPNAIIKLFPTTATGGMLLLKNLVTGLVRTAILLGYMAFCRSIPDMKRVFRYHGAEHKTVYCHEADLPLTPENARPFTTLHPRCGTSFLLITFILSIVFYSIVDVVVLMVSGYDLGAHYLLRVLSRVILLPVVAGISYEALKGLAHSENKLCRILRAPGMQLQRLTTAEPDDSMLEVAIVSMKAALGDMPDGPLTPEGYVIAIPAPKKDEAPAADPAPAQEEPQA